MGTDPSRAAIEAASVTQKVAAITRRSNRKPEKQKNYVVAPKTSIG